MAYFCGRKATRDVIVFGNFGIRLVLKLVSMFGKFVSTLFLFMADAFKVKDAPWVGVNELKTCYGTVTGNLL